MGPRRVESVTFAVTDRDGQPQGAIAPADPGSVTCTGGRRVWRGCDLSPADWEALDVYDCLITPTWTVDGVSTQVGVFAPVSGTAAYAAGNQRSADTSVTRSASVDLADQAVFLDIQLAQTVSVPVGQSPTPVIEGLLEAAGFTVHDVTLLPALTEPAVFDGTALDAIDSMCSASGAYPLYFTAAGVPTVELAPAPQDMTADFVYTTGDGIVVGVPEFPFDAFAPNAWEAVGATDTAPQAGAYALAPGVTGWLGQRGFTILDRFDVRAVSDSTTLDAAARSAAVTSFAGSNAVAFDTVAVPAHGAWDVLSFDGSLFLEESWTLPLAPGSTMGHRAGAVLVPT